MSGLNWRNAKLTGKRSLSTRDEIEYGDRDAASRWLTRHEKPAKKAGKKSQFVAAGSSPEAAIAGAAPPSVPAPIHKTDDAKTLPGIAILGRPATANTSAQEPDNLGSGGVHGREAAHPATPIHDDIPAFLRAAS